MMSVPTLKQIYALFLERMVKVRQSFRFNDLTANAHASLWLMSRVSTLKSLVVVSATSSKVMWQRGNVMSLYSSKLRYSLKDSHLLCILQKY